MKCSSCGLTEAEVKFHIGSGGIPNNRCYPCTKRVYQEGLKARGLDIKQVRKLARDPANKVRKTRVDFPEPPENHHYCLKCELPKPREAFRTMRGGPRGDCDECSGYKEYMTEYGLHRRYSLSKREYRILFEKQQGLCGLCCKPESAHTASGIRKLLAVDHCHTTGKVRKLLCARCNTTLGKVGENTELLRRMIQYIESQGEFPLVSG